MFGLKRQKYRKAVETRLSYLVGFDEAYFQRIYRSFEGIGGVIDDAFKDGRDPTDLAVELWGIMFSYEIERSPQLTAEGERIIQYLSNGGDYRYDTEAAMKVFINTADIQAKMGKISDELVDRVVDEIVGALRGIERNERAARRMARYIEEAVTGE